MCVSPSNKLWRHFKQNHEHKPHEGKADDLIESTILCNWNIVAWIDDSLLWEEKLDSILKPKALEVIIIKGTGKDKEVKQHGIQQYTQHN